MLRVFALLTGLLLAHAANAFEVKSCDDANVGVSELVTPAAKFSRTFKDDKISVYEVDTVEPACCSGGIAIVIPDVDNELGGNKCLAVVGVASVQLDEADKGVLLTIPTKQFNEGSDSVPGPPLKLRVNLEKGSVVAE
jgi:hypothetical protein